MTSSTKERSPATDSEADSPGQLNHPFAGDTDSNRTTSSDVCELCPPTTSPPPPLPLLRVKVLLCGAHIEILSGIGLTPAERALARREKFYLDRERASRGVNLTADTWLTRRYPNPLYWVTMTADHYATLRATVARKG